MKNFIVAALIALSAATGIAAATTAAHADFWSEKTKDGI